VADIPSPVTAAERDSNNIIEQQLRERAVSLEQAADADVLTYIGAIFWTADERVKDAVEGIDNRRSRLLVLLETGGGYIDATERIALIFRHHYRQVEFVIPTYAMSAGTILAMSGDAIHMDYASVLGPIDPQVERGETLVPALGYLEQYKRLVQKSADGELTTAELAYFIQNFDAAELFQYEQERLLSIALLEEWLVKYKFKNWKETETRKDKVTPTMRKKRAREIAEKLNEVDRWHSHSRVIPMEVARRDLNLLIDDFGENPVLARPVHDYFKLLKDYMMRRGHIFNLVIHTRSGYGWF
jgi:hypothetical protein